MIPAVDSHNFYSDMTVGIRWPQASQHTGRLAAPWESKAVKCRVGTTLMGSVYNARLMVYDPRLRRSFKTSIQASSCISVAKIAEKLIILPVARKYLERS